MKLYSIFLASILCMPLISCNNEKNMSDPNHSGNNGSNSNQKDNPIIGYWSVGEEPYYIRYDDIWVFRPDGTCNYRKQRGKTPDKYNYTGKYTFKEETEEIITTISHDKITFSFRIKMQSENDIVLQRTDNDESITLHNIVSGNTISSILGKWKCMEDLGGFNYDGPYTSSYRYSVIEFSSNNIAYEYEDWTSKGNRIEYFYDGKNLTVNGGYYFNRYLDNSEVEILTDKILVIRKDDTAYFFSAYNHPY